MKKTNSVKLLSFIFCTLAAINSEGQNLRQSNDMWTSTSPGEQVLLSVMDLVFIASARKLEDSDFRGASKDYKEKMEKQKIAEERERISHQRLSLHEKKLKDLRDSQRNIEHEIAQTNTQVTNLEAALTEAQNMPTIAEKAHRISVIRPQMATLAQKAMESHPGVIDNFDVVFHSLQSGDKQQFDLLRQEYNKLVTLPDVETAQKAINITNAKDALAAAKKSKDQLLLNFNSLDGEITTQSKLVETTRPSLIEAERIVELERAAVSSAKGRLAIVAAEKKFTRVKWRLLRWGSYVVFAVDLGSRVGYYMLAEEDPGWFPFFRVLRRVF